MIPGRCEVRQPVCWRYGGVGHRRSVCPQERTEKDRLGGGRPGQENRLGDGAKKALVSSDRPLMLYSACQ
jgi:hypothetical protein